MSLSVALMKSLGYRCHVAGGVFRIYTPAGAPLRHASAHRSARAAWLAAVQIITSEENQKDGTA